MKKHGMQMLVGGLAAWLSILLLTGCMSGAYQYENVNTSGTVTAKDKDSAGKVSSVEIKTESSASFVVENSGKGKELIGMIGKKVEVSGKARQDGAAKLLTVESYKVIE